MRLPSPGPSVAGTVASVELARASRLSLFLTLTWIRWFRYRFVCQSRLQRGAIVIERDFFEDLFVLEMANNHLGSVDRGLKIIDAYSRVVRFNNIRAAIKLQFRDVETFVHRDFRERTDVRYIKKTIDTRLSQEH